LAIWPKTNIDRMMKFYQAGSSDSNGWGVNQSGSSGSGSSLSTSSSAPQLSPQQLMSMYGNALPTIGNTTNAVTANSPGAPALSAAVNGATAGVNAINLNGLSPGESNAIERANNQGLSTSGNLGLNNPTNTLSNAANFGGAFNSKIGLMNNAVNSASGASNAANAAIGTTASLFNPVANSGNAQVSNSKSNSAFSNLAWGGGKSGNDSNSVNGGIGCFLTTACCTHRGLPDNCEELTVLRKFRDTFVPKDLIHRYYSIAPNICIHIQGDSNTLDYVYRVVQSCVLDIKKGRNQSALRKYKLMVHKLERK